MSQDITWTEQTWTGQNLDKTYPGQTKPRHGQNLDTDKTWTGQNPTTDKTLTGQNVDTDKTWTGQNLNKRNLDMDKSYAGRLHQTNLDKYLFSLVLNQIVPTLTRNLVFHQFVG